jgi:hypothetical protein
MKQKNPDLYSPDAFRSTAGGYPESQTPAVSWIQDVDGRRLYVTDHDVYVFEHIMETSPFNGPSFVTPDELESIHDVITKEVIPPDYSENPSE